MVILALPLPLKSQPIVQGELDAPVDRELRHAKCNRSFARGSCHGVMQMALYVHPRRNTLRQDLHCQFQRRIVCGYVDAMY